jgi:hypothetical protein
MTDDEREALLNKVVERVAEEIKGTIVRQNVGGGSSLTASINGRYADILTGRILMRLTPEEILELAVARGVLEEDKPSGYDAGHPHDAWEWFDVPKGTVRMFRHDIRCPHGVSTCEYQCVDSGEGFQHPRRMN